MRNLEVGKTYTINEDMTGFIDFTDDVKRPFEELKAGTKCKLLDIRGEFVTIEVQGIKINTADHMIE